jgi:LETM1 and EF-hand domain-containing protein 1, mitochondrial
MLRRFIPKPKLFSKHSIVLRPRQFHQTAFRLSQKQETEFEKALREAKEEPELPKTSVQTKKPLWERIKAEARHYIDGSKLLAAETSISSRLLIKVLKGTQLSRREMRQLKRTTQDLLRLVPLIIILLVPFLEFALPVLLRFFPGILPSTFESKSQEVIRVVIGRKSGNEIY